MAKSTATLQPNLGLYYSQSELAVPPGALTAGYNFRIENGRLSNLNLGWTRLGAIQLNGPVTFMDFFFVDGINERDIWMTPTDLYSYDPSNDTVNFVTPVYVTGTAASSGTAVTGSGTAWNTNDAHSRHNAQAGDYIAFGSATENDPAANWYKVQSVADDTHLTLATSAGVHANGPYTLRRTMTGDVSDRWSSDFFPVPGGTEYWYGTNGQDPIIRWDGTSTFAEFSTITTRAKTLRVHANMLILGAVTLSNVFYPTSFANSQPGVPETFTGGLAAQLIAYEGTNPIEAIEPIGDNLAIYSRRTVTLAQFTGDTTVWALRQVISGLGPIAGGLIADLGDYHEFVGSDAQYYFDGVSIKETAHQVWREVVRTRDPNRQANGFIHFNEEHGDLMWFMPLVTDSGVGNNDSGPDSAFVEHYLEETGDKYETPFSLRSCPFTCAGYTERRGTLQFDSADAGPTWADMNFRWNDQALFVAFPLSICGDSTGKVWSINVSQFADGAPLPSYVRFGRRAMADARMRALLTRVYPFVSPQVNNLDVTCRFFEAAEGPAVLTKTYTMAQGGSYEQHFVPIYDVGRFYDVSFGSAVGDPWQLSGWDYDVKPGGLR